MKSFVLNRLSFISLALAVSFLAPGPAIAQDSDQEIVAELEQAGREKSRLSHRLGVVERRIGLLKELREHLDSLSSLESQVERASDRGDDDRTEALERKLHLGIIDLRQTRLHLEELEVKAELSTLRSELHEEGLEAEVQEADRLRELHKERSQVMRRLIEIDREPESDEREHRERELEREEMSLEGDYERRLEILHLKLELHFAIDEDREEEIAELEQELRALGVIEEEPLPDFDVSEMPKPIQPSEEEITNASTRSFSDDVVPMLRKHCFECHDASTSEGGLDLQRLIGVQPLVIHRSQWINVKQQLRVGSMPPQEQIQPSDDERRALVAWLTHAIDRFDYSTVRQPGYEPARRLTHEEYNRTIRDLFGVDLRPADQFPVDLTASSGFENSANSLFIQPITMERYIGAAERIVDELFSLNPESDEQRVRWDRFLQGGTPQQAIASFARRAFRRPLEEGEENRLAGFLDALRSRGVEPKAALKQAIQVVLISPNFLIHSERDRESHPGESFRISDHELASRLSYFLWSSMPDEELFRLADAGSLHQADVLAAQVDRMIADERAVTLGSIFASQWLGFANLARVGRDQIDNPWATDSLFKAMHEESAMFFRWLLEQNQPIERLVDAEITFVNEELADHYQIEGVEGPEMRLVSLEDSPRGGILGHGSILSITSFPGRTSPVIRGNWILSTLLGTPPPPPPPNVSEFDDQVAHNRALTQRQKLQIHRTNPNCYACHSEIDPLGFALECFEWYGRYRPKRRGRRIDASGELPSGRKVIGLEGLRRAIVQERRDDLVNQMSRKMLSYALGRQLQYYDEATVADVIKKVEADERRMQTLIHAVVASEAFQMKQIGLE